MSSSSNSGFAKIFFIGLAIIFLMAITDSGPFKKGTSTSSHQEQSISHGENVSFGGGGVYSYTEYNARSRDGVYHCKVRVYNSNPNMAYCNGATYGSQIYSAGYGDPGTRYCYWGSVAVFF